MLQEGERKLSQGWKTKVFCLIYQTDSVTVCKVYHEKNETGSIQLQDLAETEPAANDQKSRKTPAGNTAQF